MPDKTSIERRQQCILECRDTFIEYTETKPVGGVEALRICREGCDSDAVARMPS